MHFFAKAYADTSAQALVYAFTKLFSFATDNTDNTDNTDKTNTIIQKKSSVKISAICGYKRIALSKHSIY